MSLNSEDDWIFDYVCMEPEASAEEEEQIDSEQVHVASPAELQIEQNSVISPPETAPIDLILRRIDTNIAQHEFGKASDVLW